MADAFTETALQVMARVRYELRDVNAKQWDNDELFVYLLKCVRLIYDILVQSRSELVGTGSGTITTVANTERYSLAANNMGDLWVPWRVAVVDTMQFIEPIEEKESDDRFESMLYATVPTGPPNGYYLEGDMLGILPVPDSAYTIRIKYFPNHVPIAMSSYMPFRGLFTLQIEEGMKIFAKNRESSNIGIEASLMQIFQDRAFELMGQRRKIEYHLNPRLS